MEKTFRFRDFVSKNPSLIVDEPISHHDLTRLDHSTSNDQIFESVLTNGNLDSSISNMQCCCGRADCAWLEHNKNALGGLEKDLETAARLGQVRAVMPLLHLVTSWVFATEGCVD